MFRMASKMFAQNSKRPESSGRTIKTCLTIILNQFHYDFVQIL